MGTAFDRVVPVASGASGPDAEPQAGERSAGRSFERPALGRTFASYVSVRMGSSSGLSFPDSRPLSALLVPHRCPVGGAVPVKPADVQSAAVSCRERRDVFGSLLRKRGRFLIKWLIFPSGAHFFRLLGKSPPPETGCVLPKSGYLYPRYDRSPRTPDEDFETQHGLVSSIQKRGS